MYDCHQNVNVESIAKQIYPQFHCAIRLHIFENLNEYLKRFEWNFWNYWEHNPPSYHAEYNGYYIMDNIPSEI